MDKQTLKIHIKNLKQVRDVSSSRLDIRATTKLDGAIAALQECHDHHHSAQEAAKLIACALQAIAAFVSIATKISDWL